MGAIQQWTQHPLRVCRAEGADVGVKQAHHLGVLTGHPKPLPDRPALAGGTGDLESQGAHGLQQVLHGWAIGPVHLNGKGHAGEEGFGMGHVLRAFGGQSNDEAIESFQ